MADQLPQPEPGSVADIMDRVEAATLKRRSATINALGMDLRDLSEHQIGAAMRNLIAAERIKVMRRHGKHFYSVKPKA